MDYLKADRLFQARKVLRYVGLYGLGRTIAKIRGQLHAQRQFESLPPERSRASSRHVGLIGCGNYSYSTIAYYLAKLPRPVLRAAMDVDINRAASLFADYDCDYYTADAGRLIDDPQIDLIYIASNHASHAEYAIAALEAGKSVHIEKPHAVSLDQLRRLCVAMERSKGRVGLGFNRPDSKVGLAIREALASQSGASMLSWFVAGHAIDPDHWYFKPEEGGRVLGNLCHWTDFVYHCIAPEDRYPITIRPTRAERSDCDIGVTYTFGDGSIAVITFSAKGHTFEGVRERFAAHRGDVLISMDDFQSLTIERVEAKRTQRGGYRDHGHKRSILRSYDAAHGRSTGVSVAGVWETGELFLRTRQALEEDRMITVSAFARDKLMVQSRGGAGGAE